MTQDVFDAIDATPAPVLKRGSPANDTVGPAPHSTYV